MATFKLLMVQFPGFSQLHPASMVGYNRAYRYAAAHPQIGEKNIGEMWIADTPITMGRNRACMEAIAHDYDYLWFNDADNEPDYLVGHDRDAKPFFETAWKFLMGHRDKPCVIAAPYCGPSPDQTVFVARWATDYANNPTMIPKLEPFSRDEAATKTGIEAVAGLATGVMLIDVRVLKAMAGPSSKLQQPGCWFDYEWEDPPYNTKKASTEDYRFSRDASFMGFPLYVAWDCWAAHWKLEMVGKPQRIGAESVARHLREQIIKGVRSDAKVMEVEREGPAVPPMPNRQMAEPVLAEMLRGHPVPNGVPKAPAGV